MHYIRNAHSGTDASEVEINHFVVVLGGSKGEAYNVYMDLGESLSVSIEKLGGMFIYLFTYLLTYMRM